MQQIMTVPPPFTVTVVTSMPRILIVDDQESVVSVFQRILQRLTNYEVIALTESEEALQRFHQEHFDLLITDYQMPKMNGITLIKNIRQVSAQIPIIMITASVDREFYEQTVDLSIYRILCKPIGTTELCQAVSGALSGDGSI